MSPRSPAEGSATRGPADLEIAGGKAATRDRRVRSGIDRRVEDVGAPDGNERRRHARRSHDRRARTPLDRRLTERRNLGQRRAPARTGARHLPSTQMGPVMFQRSRTPRLLRIVLITVVAIACLLAATLTGPSKAGAATITKPAAKGIVQARAGGVSASITYAKTKDGEFKQYTSLVLTVKAKGRTTLSKLRLRGKVHESSLTRPQVMLGDVTGDGVLDPVISIYTGGAHCCSVSAVVASTPHGWSAKPVVRDWADYGFALKDLGGTPQLEFSAIDARFTGAFTSYAASRAPIQIFRLEGRAFVDVTKEFPDWVKTDAAAQAKAWQDAGGQDPSYRAEAGRGAAAAWIADLSLLGDIAGAKAVVDASVARGDFTATADDPGAAAFPGDLGHLLKTDGYLADPTTIGLTDTPSTTTP